MALKLRDIEDIADAEDENIKSYSEGQINPY